MKRIWKCYLLLLSITITACSDLSNSEAENLLEEANVYPLILQYKMFCNSDQHVQLVVDKKLVANGFVTAQQKHTLEDIGQPLIYFTPKATPYLLPTNDTLRSFDIQRIKIAEEVFDHIRTIEINPAGDKAVVDYTTRIINPTPFIVLFNDDVKSEQKRRTYFVRKGERWTWDGKIVKMPR